MKEIRLLVSLTPEEIKERLAVAFTPLENGDPEFFPTKDRQFCHIRPYVERIGPLTFGNDVDSTFVDLHLKELGSQTQITISQASGSYALVTKFMILPVLWLTPFFAFFSQGWKTGLEVLAGCSIITLLLWIYGRASKSKEQKITSRIIALFGGEKVVQ